MLNLGNLKHAWKVLKEESILNCLELYESKEFSLLVESITNLEILIKRLENVERTKRLDKLM
jgi:hypothetical protein